MAKSRTFGAVPRDSVLVRVQATRGGKVVSTQSYRVIGTTIEAVCQAIEPALEKQFGSGEGDADDEDDLSSPAHPSTETQRQENVTATSIQDVVELSRRVTTEAAFEEFMLQMRRAIPAPARKSVGALTGRAVADFQNWLYDENVKWRLTDLQILAVIRAEFPINDGQVFTGDIRTGLGHIASIRTEYNRTGHGGPTPVERGLRPSVSYGRVRAGDAG